MNSAKLIFPALPHIAFRRADAIGVPLLTHRAFVDYSRPTGEDEAGTALAVTEHREAACRVHR